MMERKQILFSKITLLPHFFATTVVSPKQGPPNKIYFMGANYLNMWDPWVRSCSALEPIKIDNYSCTHCTSFNDAPGPPHKFIYLLI